ncbi:MAG: molybdenum cofactor biosynthesis protein MoaE [Pseudomonadota bacterium]
MIDINALIETIRQGQRFSEVGMIACHKGIVRGLARNGQKVSTVEVIVDWDRLKQVINRHEDKPGISNILVEAKEGVLKPGEDIMAVLVAGDTRDHVFPVLQQLVDAIKDEVTQKKETFDYSGT